MAWEAGKELSVEDIEVAPPKAHEVRIQIYHTGVCHTGQHTFARLLSSRAELEGRLSSGGRLRSELTGPLSQMRTLSQGTTPRGLSPSSSGTRVPALSNR